MQKEVHEEYNFREAIYKVLKQVHPDAGITEEAMNEVNLMTHYLVEQYSWILLQQKNCNQVHPGWKLRYFLTGKSTSRI